MAEAAPNRPLHSRLGRAAIVAFVWTYRITLGPFLGGQCRYTPTCSQYMLDAVEKYGPVNGAYRGVKRICRCHPWGGSGFDPA
jgi:putative membrane protein insertion efficiency factor